MGNPLCYLKDSKSLMSHDLGESNTCLYIDDETIEIIRALGWNLPSESLRIKCTDIDATGIGSCYVPHVFTLEEHNFNIKGYLWTFSLKDKEGKYELISQSRDRKFTVSKISNPSKYQVNTNGDLDGKIECKYYIGEEEYFAEPYHVSLEQKPLILSVSNLTRKWNQEAFALDFNVTYTGAERIYVEIEEEYDDNVRSYRIDEPIIAHVKTGLISGWFYSWITIEASNKYGTTRETLEFPPFFREDHKLPEIAGVEYPYQTTINAEIQIFNLNGYLIYEGPVSEFPMETLQSGIYIKKILLPSGETITSKISIK